MRNWFACAVFALVVFPAEAQADRTRAVDKATFSGVWPLTVDAAVLGCDAQGLPYVVVKGKKYGITGAASGKYGVVDPVWAKASSSGNLRKNIGDLIAAGLALCD